jgi:hypothetical protein
MTALELAVVFFEQMMNHRDTSSEHTEKTDFQGKARTRPFGSDGALNSVTSNGSP